jgi:hypothetical protein
VSKSNAGALALLFLLVWLGVDDCRKADCVEAGRVWSDGNVISTCRNGAAK